MSTVLEEMQAILEGDVTGDELMHYGTKFHSGRYPYGSGEDPYQHDGDILTRIERLKKDGWVENAENVMKEFGMKLEEYRREKSWANYTRRELNVSRAKSLKEKGMSNTEIGREMGVNESTVRSWLDQKAEDRMRLAKQTADMLKSKVDEKGMIMVGTGVERELRITRDKLDTAIYALEAEGYITLRRRVEQKTNPGKFTTLEVIAPPGTKKDALYTDLDKVKTIDDYVSNDGGESYHKKFTYPESLDSKRLMIRYSEDGGVERDGLVELRRGVDDLDLQGKRYAQVRIMVDGTHYIKGMAVYSDNMPDGVDVIFNTNKTKGTPMTKVLKEIKQDPDNPFGSLIKDADQGGQYWYKDKDGNDRLGLINKRADEGDWNKWKDTLSSQFLSKQSLPLIKKQLKIASDDKQAEFDDICALDNPTVKKYWLNKFADECDSAAVHLKAAALPGQKYHAIIPINSLKDNEIYAPQYENGSEVALVRYPHGGTFEIPVLKVNNKHKPAIDLLGNDIVDAVGINHKVAERLSGADFDGDTVMCIPTKDATGKVKVKINSREPLEGLKGFEPKTEYAERPGMKYMKDPVTKKDSTQLEMGKISNLITDMTLFGATDDELTRAVKHSMVVIDAAKHKLDYTRSATENGIAALHKKYQGHYDENGKWHNAGAGTIVSRSSGEDTVTKRVGTPKVNIKGTKDYDPSKPEGSLLYKIDDDAYYPVKKFNKSDKTYTVTKTDGKKVTYDANDEDAVKKYEPVKRVDPKTGAVSFANRAGDIEYKYKTRTQASTKMAETNDANTLVSAIRHPKELAYADYANKMKALANEARKQAYSTQERAYDSSAAKVYQAEVASLKSKLNEALMNAPRERYAQIRSNVAVEAKKASDPNLSKADLKKAGQQAVSKYRAEFGSVKRSDRNIKITDREWEAIQAGAVTKTDLRKILNNSDADSLRERAMPKASTTVSQVKINRMKAMSASGKSLYEIASALGLSPTTVSKHLKGDD